MTETAERPVANQPAAAGGEVEAVLQQVREAVARTREAIAETQELLGAAPHPDDEAAAP
jgi:hypothetical protein